MSKTTTLALRQVASIRSGKTPSRRTVEYWGGTRPWVSAKDMKTPVVATSQEQLTDRGFAAASVTPRGSVLVLTRGMTLFKNVPVCLTATEMAFNQDVKALVPREGVDAAYLAYFLRAHKQDLLGLVDSSGHGTGRLDTEALATFPVLVPPIATQRRVVRMLAVWDAAVGVTERLFLAKRVELVSLLATVAANSPGRSTQLGDICDIFRGQGLTKDDLRVEGAYPCILYGELHTTYGEVVTEVRSRTDVLTPTRSLRGDVLIPSSSETSEDLANASAVNRDDVLLGGDINILRSKYPGEYDAEYLAYYLTHCRRREIARLAQGNSIVHLYGRDIARLEVTLPSIEQQVRIASALEFGRREIAVLERIRDRYLVQRRGVAQVLFGPAGVSIPGGPSEDAP